MNTIHIIQVVHEGVLDADPRVFTSPDEAGRCFELQVRTRGFRPCGPKEPWSSYVEAFGEWEDSDACPYDKMDWEIHWWKDMPVDAEIHNPKTGLQMLDEFEKWRTEQDLAPDTIYYLLNGNRFGGVNLTQEQSDYLETFRKAWENEA